MKNDLCQRLDNNSIVDNETLIYWLEKQAKEWQLNYLLAHAEDGVIWGQFNDYKLITAEKIYYQSNFDIALPSLRLLTLQQCRIFGERGEILLWRTNKEWKSRLVQDKLEVEHIPEEQIIWGTQKEKGKNGEDGEKDGFTLLSDAPQGIKHAVPLTGISFQSRKKNPHRPVRLLVHHYIKYDEETGIARIFISRLVTLKSKPAN